jgi:hypothetical protein
MSVLVVMLCAPFFVSAYFKGVMELPFSDRYVAAVLEYQQGSSLCKTIQLVGKSISNNDNQP